MEMQNSVTVTFGSLTPIQAGKIVDFVGGILAMDDAQSTDVRVNPAKTETKTKATKKEAAPAKVEEKTEEPIDLGFDTTPTPAPAAKKLTLEDVIGKLQEYAGKHGRDNAGKILGKFGVKSVRDLKEDSYEKFIKELA